MFPPVDVLLPFRDASAYLPDLVEDLAAQRLPGLRVVAVDDGSSDGGAARLARLASEAGLHLDLLTPGRVGLPGALRLGLEACSAPLVARVDADDRIHPERLRRQCAALAADETLAVLGCGAESFSERGPLGGGFARYDAWQNALRSPEAIAREAFVESPLVHPTVVFRREAILAVGGYRDQGWPEDYDLWLRCLRAGLRLAKLPDVLVRWRDHPSRATRTDRRYERRAFIACKAHHLARGPLAGHREVWIWGAGPTGRAMSRALAAEGISTVAFVDVDPKKHAPSRPGHPAVLPPEHLPRPRDAFLLAAVGSPGAREQIRAYLRARGWDETRHFLAVA